MTDWSEIREAISPLIEVYYVKDAEKNLQRERDREKTIDWIISNLKLGPIKGGVIGSNGNALPEYTWTFGDSSIWSAERRGVIMRDSMCQVCGIRPSTEVHHIRPKHLNGAPLNPRNLIGLCRECHDEVHRVIDGGINSVVESSLTIPQPIVAKDLSHFGVIE